MTSRFPTSDRHHGVMLEWDKRGCTYYRGRQIKRVFRQRQGFEYRIAETKTIFDDLELVLEEIDYIVEKHDG